MARLRRPSLLVVLSDGWDGADYLEALRRAAASGHDVMAMHLPAAGDRHLADGGVVELEDAETGEVVAVDRSRRAGVVRRGGRGAWPGARSRPARAAPERHGAGDRGALAPQLRRFLAARAERD